MKKLMATVFVAAMAIVITPSAAAGGGNFLNLEEYYVPIGEPVTTEPQAVWFRNGRAATRALEQTWHLYVVHDLHQEILRPPETPPAGMLHLEPTLTPRILSANATFTVPKIPYGTADLFICNSVGCSNQLGDLWIETIHVVEDVGDVAALQKIRSMRWDIRSLRRRLDNAMDETERLNDYRVANSRDIDALEAARERLAQRVKDLERAEPPAAESPLPWAITGAVLTLVAVGAVVAYRRRTEFPALQALDEDTEPGDLTLASEPEPEPRFEAPEVYDDSMWRRPEEPVKS